MSYDYDIVVIGSGLGAALTGARMTKRGYKVLILEQHYIPGGCVTSFGRKSEKNW